MYLTALVAELPRGTRAVAAVRRTQSEARHRSFPVRPAVCGMQCIGHVDALPPVALNGTVDHIARSARVLRAPECQIKAPRSNSVMYDQPSSHVTLVIWLRTAKPPDPRQRERRRSRDQAVHARVASPRNRLPSQALGTRLLGDSLRSRTEALKSGWERTARHRVACEQTRCAAYVSVSPGP